MDIKSLEELYTLSKEKLEGFTVEKVYLKHIWEITAPAKKYPIGIQVKRNNPYALRPFNFHKKPDKCFESKEAFILAVKKAFEMFPNPSINFTADEWYNKVSKY